MFSGSHWIFWSLCISGFSLIFLTAKVSNKTWDLVIWDNLAVRLLLYHKSKKFTSSGWLVVFVIFCINSELCTTNFGAFSDKNLFLSAPKFSFSQIQNSFNLLCKLAIVLSITKLSCSDESFFMLAIFTIFIIYYLCL